MKAAVLSGQPVRTHYGTLVPPRACAALYSRKASPVLIALRRAGQQPADELSREQGTDDAHLVCSHHRHRACASTRPSGSMYFFRARLWFII